MKKQALTQAENTADSYSFFMEKFLKAVLLRVNESAGEMSNVFELPQELEAQSYLAAIIASSDDAIVSKDLNGNITSWNPSAERIFGYTAAEAVGKHISLIIPPENLSEEDYILSKIRNGERIDHFETLRRAKNGRLINISVTVSPIRNREGVVIGASKVARDISERIKAEQAIVESGRKKDEFLTNMSHELRTPMNAVIGLAGLLKSLEGMPEKAIKYIDTLKISADNLMELINDILDFAKIESGIVQLENVKFSLAEQIEKIISITNVKAREKNLALYVNFCPSLNHYYTGDPLRLQQIVMNLLSNAVKFTEKGSIDVDITGVPASDAAITHVTFKISDTGIGIAKDMLDNIFDKFIQADSSITRRFGGSGLGLAISKALTEAMGGSLTVESEVGIGTTFILRLPLQNSEKSFSIERSSVNAILQSPSENKNVLLVEDYEPNIIVAGTFLELLGYNYEVARNGVEALRKFTHGRYDVILMDSQMPDLDGLEAARRIRRIESDKGLARTPIVAMTAHVRQRDKDMCIDAGMDDFISKPFNPQTLSQKISRFIGPHAEMQKSI